MLMLVDFTKALSGSLMSCAKYRQRHAATGMALTVQFLKFIYTAVKGFDFGRALMSLPKLSL
jgi:hypothetical protein